MAYNSFLSLISTGLAANRPTTPEFPSQCFYYETDTFVTNLWTGSAWTVFEVGYNPAMTGLTASVTQTLAGALQLTGGYANVATVGTANDAVKLPPSPRVGQTITVTNSAGANAMKVFPGESTSTIDGGSAGASVTISAAKSASFTCIAAGAWQSIGSGARAA